MLNKKLVFSLAVLLAVPAAFFAYRWTGDMRGRALVSDELSAEPLKEYCAGRYVLKVPAGLKLSEHSFSVTPDEPYEGLQFTDSIKIVETPWVTHNHDLEFEQSYAKIRAKQESFFIKNNMPDDGGTYYTENMDARDLFDIKSVCIAYDDGGTEMPIESFVYLQKGILNIVERRLYNKIPQGTDIERPAVNLFRHYRWGRTDPHDKNIFFTAYGYLENYKSAYESVDFSFRDANGITLTYNIWGSNTPYQGPDADDPVPTIPYIKREMAKIGINVTVLRTRSFERGGVTFKERMLRFTSSEAADEYVFTLTVNYEEKLTPPGNPKVDIEMEGKWSTVEQAVPYWNSVVANIRPVSVDLSVPTK